MLLRLKTNMTYFAFCSYSSSQFDKWYIFSSANVWYLVSVLSFLPLPKISVIVSFWTGPQLPSRVNQRLFVSCEQRPLQSRKIKSKNWVLRKTIIFGILSNNEISNLQIFRHKIERTEIKCVRSTRFHCRGCPNLPLHSKSIVGYWLEEGVLGFFLSLTTSAILLRPTLRLKKRELKDNWLWLAPRKRRVHRAMRTDLMTALIPVCLSANL